MKKKLFMILILVIIILFSFGISKTKEPEKIVKEPVKEVVIEKKEETLEIDPNSDIVGTVYIPDTDFKAVITQTSDNTYYLNHDVEGRSVAKGNPFLDYRDSVSKSRILRIYGHNSRTISTEFHILEGYLKEKYYQEHPYIYFETKIGTKKYQIFSTYTEVKDWSYYNANFNSDEVYKNELAKYKSKSLYNTGVEVTEKDRILILQTCSYEKQYAKYKNKYILVMAKEV